MTTQLKRKTVGFILTALSLVSICFLFKYLLDVERENALFKEQQAEAERLLLKKEKQREQQLRSEHRIQQAREREQFILENRAVLEQDVTAENTNQELLSRYYIAVPTPVEPWKDETYKLLKSPLGQQMLYDLLTIPEDMPSFKTLSFQERTYKALFQYFDPILAEGKINVTTHPSYKDTWKLYNRLEQTLFPWIRPHWKNVFEVNKKTSGKGIVMCVGNGQFKHAMVTIQSIRNILKSDMPIEVFYIADYDLSEDKRAYLESFPNVTTHALVDRINNYYTQFGGWDIKPYAMLASRFTEVVLMDADVFLFKKPESFFNDDGYKHTGALFFLDRTLFNHYEGGRRWLKSFLPSYSTYVEEARWWKTTSAHEQESGIVVMDKKKVLLGLLATCKMNDKEERDRVSYRHIHGDKETFWIGFEMIQTPYAFVRSYGAVLGGIGDEGPEGMVCGNQLHIDTLDDRPWWWNGGIFRDKHKWSDKYLKFDHFAEGEDWDFEHSCIKETSKIRKLNEREKKIGEQLVALDLQRKVSYPNDY